MTARPPRPSQTRSRTLRDGWALAALQREGTLTAVQAEVLRGEAPEWVATAVVTHGLASAERVRAVLAKAARVPVADLERVDATATQFLPEIPARQFQALALSVSDRAILIATPNPMDLDAEQTLSFVTSRTVEFSYALPETIRPLIEDAYRPERSIERLVSGLGKEATLEAYQDQHETDHGGGTIEAPAAKLVDAAIADAVREGASDLHLEPTLQGLVVRYRVDGVLREVMRVPRSAANAVVRRIKITSGLDITDSMHPHDGRATARVDGKAWDLRVSTVPIARLGEKVVIRLLDPESQTLKLGNMGLSPEDRRALDALLGHREGIVLVTGPTGSGKTSTLYAALDAIRTVGINVVTVEDPVEYRIQGVNQIEVNEAQGFTFAAALRSVLRQDPDIVLLGEIRDLETARTAWQAALSGHFVLSTLHTNDSASSIMRLRDIGIESYKIASALKGVVAQRLMRRLCSHCAQDADVTTLPEAARPPAGTPDVRIRRPKGCPKCLGSGYRGRFAIEEILTVDAAVARLITDGASSGAILEAGRRAGLRTLWVAGLRRVWSGDSGYDEVVRVVGQPAAGSPEAEAPPETPSPADAPERRLILVADDDPMNREVAGAALRAAGFQVAEAVDGLQALMEAQRLHPAVLLLDLEMPNMDGLMVLGALRQRLSGRSVPVIVVTSKDDADTERRCVELGAEDFITKPVKPESLVARVEAVLRRVTAAG